MTAILGLTYGPSAPALRPQPYEVGPAFGPCESGESFFCQGAGFETIDPAAMVNVETAFRTAILCGACRSHRESEALAKEVWGE
jgi:hypothetical protein